MPRHLFIVSRLYPEFHAYLLERFADDTNVEVILDRRTSERRRQRLDVTLERRRTDRRTRTFVDVELETRSHSIVTLD